MTVLCGIDMAFLDRYSFGSSPRISAYSFSCSILETLVFGLMLNQLEAYRFLRKSMPFIFMSLYTLMVCPIMYWERENTDTSS